MRLFTWGLFGLTVFMAWQAWQLDYAAPPSASPAPPPVTEAGTPEPTPADTGDLPALADFGSEAPAAAQPPAAEADTAAAETAQTVTVTTDVVELEISLRGADLVGARILRYPVRKDNPDEVITLLGDAGGDFGAYRSGLTTGRDQGEPNHRALYQAASGSYAMGAADELIVPLTWSRPDGLSVTKTYRLTRGSYRIDVDYLVTNGSSEPFAPQNYVQIARTAREQERSMFDVDSYSFDGPVLHDGDSYDKYGLDEFDQAGGVTVDAMAGWLATIRHHFLTAAIPPQDQTWRYTLRQRNGRYVVSAIGGQQTIDAGATGVFATTLFVGPKLQDQLEEIVPSLKLTVDYGILTVLAQPLFWLLSKVHDVVGNWGWAIIIVTVLIKLVFYKLTATSGRSMAKMRELQPRLKQIQERYKDDRQKLSQAMMDLYKREKVNPAAGCLPILVQMPFFLAFYWVLLESV
ncbi:MAG: membrane protein insertase YidC, partial [Pseudomonadota bacterium]